MAIMRSHVLRSVAAALGVGAVVGLVVAGGGARLAMGLIALADDREDFGAITGSGAFVGEITFGGTVAVLATGMALGIVGALVYLALRSWLPARARYRSLVFVVIVLGLGLFVTIDGNQGDFVFLNTAVSIASFAAVLLLYALVVPPLIDRLAPRTVRRSPWAHGVVAAVLALSLLVGAPAVKHAFEYADGSRLPG
jgi:ABC-type transport system involved in cytochrome c biogenesis permease subunit